MSQLLIFGCPCHIIVANSTKTAVTHISLCVSLFSSCRHQYSRDSSSSSSIFLPSFLPSLPPSLQSHSLTLDTTIYHGISSIFISGVCLCWIPCFVAPRSVKRDYTTIMLPPGVPAIYQGTIHNDVHRHTITRRARSTIRLSCPL